MTRHLMVIATLALATVAHGQSAADGHMIERAFPEGGIVTLKLSSGDYTVRAGAAHRVRVLWHAKESHHEKDLKKVRVTADVADRYAAITTEGPTSRAQFTIEVPARSDVHLRMRAGDVRIEGVEGNKDVRMTAGELHIDVHPDSLRHAHASVSIGDLRAGSLGVEKDGFRNSLDWFGDGQYTLDARLFAGDVVLE